MQVILGIDPGSVVTGYGVIQSEGSRLTALDFGCVRPSKKDSFPKRLTTIFEGVIELIQKFKPHAIAVETQFVYKNASSALKLGMARGVILVAGTLHQVPIYEYAPRKAKIAATGSGSASKYQVQKMIQLLLQLDVLPTPEDAADALALAVCHTLQKEFLYV